MNKFPKLIVIVMGQNCQEWLDICFDSVKEADELFFIDGGSSDKTIEIAKKYCGENILFRKYDKNDTMNNGKHRNFYLDKFKIKFNDGLTWCLALDADECLDDDGIKNIKKFISNVKKEDPKIYSVHMRHLINDLEHEDATREHHMVPTRLFLIREGIHYLEREHSYLIPNNLNEKLGDCNITTIWHLQGILPICLMWKERFENNLKNSLETHPREYLDSWYSSHIFGTYPLKKINPIELPKSLLENFHISKEHIYFNERQLNLKHFLMLRQWIDFYFNRFVAKPTIIDFGCGLGCFGWVARYLNVDYKGVDISKWATENNPYNLNIVEGNIVNYKDKDFPSSLVLCIDILEHLEEEELEKALENIKTQGKLFIFSIPFLGNPDLFSDKSHKLFKTREEWKNILSKYFNLELPPMDWLYKEQILIGVPK